MSQSINAFKANFSGGARPNQFRVLGSFPLGTTDGSDAVKRLPFVVKAASIPAATVGEIILPYRGRQLKIAGDKTWEPWELTIVNDENFHVRNAFESWSNLISTHETNLNPTINHLYMQDWQVQQLDRNGLVIAEYNMIGCWPSVVSSIELSMDSTDTIEEFNVTLNYQYSTHVKPEATTDGLTGLL